MKLYFIRHGKAGYNAPSDEERPLTDAGIEQAKNNGLVLKRMGVQPAHIYTSPRRRAQETAEYLGQALDVEPEIRDACNFSFSVDKALALIEDAGAEDEIFFVGHNPSMSEVVYGFTGAQVDMSTCAIACVTRFMPGHGNSGILKWLITPKIVSGML